MEALDLAVGLGSVRAGALGLNAQLPADGLPGLGSVGGTVVGQDSLYPDSSGAEPCHRALEHADGGIAFSSSWISL